MEIDIKAIRHHVKMHGCYGAVHHRQVVTSTNDWAKRVLPYIKQSEAFFASRQTRGRGRSGRSWDSPLGKGLYLSLAVPDHGLTQTGAAVWHFGSAWSIEHNLREVLPEIRVKWPNDIIWRGKKLSGVLVEWITRASSSIGIVIGIGLNLKEPEKGYPAPPERISLEGCGLHKVDSTALTVRILDDLVKVRQHAMDSRFGVIMEWFQEWGWMPGGSMWVRTERAMEFVEVLEVGEDGTIEVRTQDGTRLYSIQKHLPMMDDTAPGEMQNDT